MPELVTAEEVRRLRGDRSRAAFAKELGVTAHTVYRWEQPESSPHARRPSGAQLELLRQRAVPATEVDDPLDAGAVRALGAIERVLDGDWRAGETTALGLLAADTGTSRVARALAGTCVALVEAIFRADARRAALALAPARPELATLPPAAAAYTEAALALTHALPSGALFDARRVHAHVVRAESLARAGDGAIAGLLCLAESNAALLMGDEEALLRAFARIDDHGGSTGAAVIDLHVEQLRSLEATLRGQSGTPTDRLERLLADPRLATCPPLEARTCAMLALRRLDELGDPESAIALARKSRAIATRGRLEPGVHTAIAMRAEAEALLRAGRLAEVAAVCDEADRMFTECGVPLTVVLSCQARYYLFTGQAGAIDALAARLRACENPSLRATCEAFAACLDAMASLTRVDDAEIALPRFARAEELAMRWSLLRRDVLLARVNATVVHGTRDEARAMLRRAQRLADRIPSAWLTAHLRRLEGTLLVMAGRWREGRAMVEAAAGMFELAGDRMDAALARHGVAAVERHLGEPGAEQRVHETRAALDALGFGVPAFLTASLARLAEISTPVADSSDGRGIEALLVAVERLSAPGTTPPVVLRELVQVVAAHAPGRAVVVDEVDSDGAVHHVAGGPAADGLETFEFGDGLGRRLRLGVGRPLADPDRAAVRLIALAGAMALEIASLRGLGHAFPGPSDDAPEIPGLVAVSPAMRRLRGDVARLAGSRATVVITGESGTGKEVIARAIHDRSPRAGQPYVAFNCAAVPHDLFEAQLFGHRRGAFTGASADQPGVVRAASGGTLFLDEIGELPLEVQPKLLRFLENGEVFPIGAQRPVEVDVRVLAATHRDLADLVRQGRFREDLYYRLQVVPLRIPPLRERRDDIPALARHFARLLAPAGATPVFAPDALATLTAHDWPGNVRELRNVIERVLAYAPPPDVITAAHLAFT